MTLLVGHKFLALGGMKHRPLARYLSSLGAEIVTDVKELANVSFLIDDIGLEGLEDMGLSRAHIEKDNPGLIHASVTPFGSGGPRARWKGSELVASAAGGALRLTGDPDRRPVKEAGDACTFHADMVAASGVMAAFLKKQQSGLGQHVDVSIQEVAFSRNVSGILGWQFDKRKIHRTGGALNYGKATVRCIWKLADGWCFHSLMTGKFGAPANKALADWMTECGFRNPMTDVDWLSYNRSTLPADTRADWEAALTSFFESRTKAEILDEGRRRGINACVAAEPKDVLGDPHLKARDFWQKRADGLMAPKRFVDVRRGDVAGEPKPVASAGRSGPLSGVKVLDFSWALVGSVTTKTLGDLGAEVVKVESRMRPCMSRMDVQVSASKPGNFDDKPWFAHLNSSKKSLSLNLKKPEARNVLNPLIEWADVVVENFSPGTMAKLGLDYDSLIKTNPCIVMVSGSVYGQMGPLAQEWGVDGTGGALSGRTYLTGWADRDPVIPGAVPYGDVIVPYVMAATAAAALADRGVSGKGCHIDASMYEICVQQMLPAILSAQSGHDPERAGNEDPGVYAQGVYPALGDDRWIAITCLAEDDFTKLQHLAGGHDISAWTSTHIDHEIVELLQSAGIAAAVVQDIEDLMDHDPEIKARGALVTLDHPHLGPFGHVRTPISFSRETLEPYQAPGLGEHNEDVATRLSGLSAEEVAEFAAAGVFE